MFMAKHKVVNEFQIQGKTIITLDSLRDVDEYRATKIQIDGKKYAFGFIHNKYMYSVDTLESLLGKTVEFVP